LIERKRVIGIPVIAFLRNIPVPIQNKTQRLKYFSKMDNFLSVDFIFKKNTIRVSKLFI